MLTSCFSSTSCPLSQLAPGFYLQYWVLCVCLVVTICSFFRIYYLGFIGKEELSFLLHLFPYSIACFLSVWTRWHLCIIWVITQRYHYFIDQISHLWLLGGCSFCLAPVAFWHASTLFWGLPYLLTSQDVLGSFLLSLPSPVIHFFPGSPASFYGRMLFRSQDRDSRWGHGSSCHWC